MAAQFEPSIVRIRTAAGKTVGAGFLVTERHVLTCAHVVTAALGLPHDAPNPPQADLHLDFPLLAPESTLTARVSHWQTAIDIAVLELISAPPAESKPVRLVTADDLWDHSFRALGFPAGYEQGVWASGILRGRQADGWLQIEGITETGYLIAPGFSGGPVWDDVLGGVVGTIVAADTDEKVKAAFLIPTDVLAETLPDLVHAYVEWAQAQLDADMDRLRARRDQADEARRELRERQRVVNLRPLDVTHTFKDRVREVQALCDHLTDSSVCLVSVVGRGGMGKTALVSRVLGDLEQGVLPVPGEEKALPIDGILYLSARSTGLGLERIYADVGRMLGEPVAGRLDARWADGSTPLTAKIEYLLEAMQDGLYLILLDNLEDNLAEDGNIAEEGLRLFVERCLTQPSGARLIVTSREQVKIAADALRSARHIPLREGLPEDEAVALLRDLDPQGTLGLRDAPEKGLRRAARLTRGIPRALEILAGILHEDPTASLPHLLADENLFGEQVVEQLVAAGYSRLGKAERRVIEALAVFDRPVEETSIAYLLHPWRSGLDVRARLHRLVRGYFVSVNRVTGRYSLHPLDREYAYCQIPDGVDEDKEPDSYNRRNLELRTADFYASIRKPESEWHTIDDLEPQLAEFEHRVRGGDYECSCRVLEPIDTDYLYKWGHYDRLVEMRENLLGRLTDPGLEASNLSGLGLAYHYLGQFKRAVKFHEKALDIAREISDRRREGVELGNLGNTHRALGQVEQAVKLYEDAIAVAREIGDRRNEGIWIGSLGSTYRDHGQTKQAIRLYEEAVVIAREIGDRRWESYRLGSLGLAYYYLGQVEQAIRFYGESLSIDCDIGNCRGEGIWLGRLGRAYRALGQFERAIKLYEKALAIAREIGDRWGESYRLLGLGRALTATGALFNARQRCAEAIALDVPTTAYQAVLTLGIVLLRQGAPTAGETFAGAVAHCRVMLDKTADLYEPRYALAAALVGQAVCDSRWAEEGERVELLAPALAEYRRALDICAAPGIVQDALRDLEMIRAAGIEGLEPVFELLESALREVQHDDQKEL